MIGKSFRKAFKKTKDLVRVCDLFSTTELLRYKENPQYKSANGGLCSIAVIIAFSIIFTQTILNTFEKVSISSLTTLFEETDPSYFTTSDSPFLFAVGLSGYNLNDPTFKYFNIELSQKSTINGNKSTKSYSLIPCNRTVWSDYDASLGSAFDTIGMNNWLCLPSSASFQFTGKYTSNIFQYMKISVKSCSILPGEKRTCVNDSYIDANITSNGPISFNYYFVNTIINADSSDYLGFYLEDRNYFQFTKAIGTSANIFISTYSIETDESLWPWASINEEKGGIVHQPTQRYVYSPTISKGVTEYVTLYVRKSSLSLSIQRSFKKYDDTLSYIGGLFSTFMATMLIMMKYNEYSYQIEISSNIYEYSKARSIKSSQFNFFSYVAYSFYCVLDFLGIAPNWTTMRHFDQVREEIGKQLDLRLLLRKINFLEDCIGYVFEDYELQCLHLKGKMTLEEAEVIRKRFSSRKQVMRIKKRIEKKEKEQDAQDKVVDNQVIIDYKVHNVIEQSNGSNQSQRLQQKRGSRRVFPVLPELPRRQEEEQSSEEQEENDDKKLLREYVDSINKLKEQAGIGNSRCQKIYYNLDKVIKSLPNCLPSAELNDTKVNINETEEKLQVGIRSSKKAIELLEIRDVQE